MLLVMWKRWFSPAPPQDFSHSQGETLEKRVEAIQAGDDAQREAFIAQYRPFIAKTASRLCRRFIDPNRDDEFSVALAAFNEAVNRYTPEGGSSFLNFADTVISRRLIDYRRQEMRHTQSIPYSSMTTDDDDGRGLLTRMENAAAMEVFERNREAEERRAEIAALTEQLAIFGIRFADLADNSPRHRDSRLTLLTIGRRLGQNQELYRMLQEKQQLPVKELSTIEGVSRKTVERHRKYLIAVSLIAAGPYPCLREYISLADYDKEETSS